MIDPNFNIVTPSALKYIFKDKKKEFSFRLSEILEIENISSIRVKTNDLTQMELNEIIFHIKKIIKDRASIIIENDIKSAALLKADGVHLTTGQNLVKSAKAHLGKYQVIGAFCGSSKHSGMVAAENGANYIEFRAHHDSVMSDITIVNLFKWWSETIEIPVMAECAKDCLISRKIWGYCDFFSLGTKIWEPTICIQSLLKPAV